MVYSETDILNYLIVPREEWQARLPKKLLTPLHTPVPYVVIHHSYNRSACYNRQECSEAMRQLQDMHMDVIGLSDIGFHFAIGGDGDVYEGRGWKALGAHALHFNAVSLGFTLIGDWRNETPPLPQINTLKALLTTGVELHYIRPDYKIIGHDQVAKTECPGKALRQLIQSWEHYSSFPGSYKDLINVREVPDVVKQLIANAAPTNTTVMY